MVSETEKTAGDLLAVLAEPNRRRLLDLLRGGEQTVTELAAQFSVTRPAISQHLGVLAAAGLVEARQDGRFRRYRLNPDGMAALRGILDAFWTSELEQLVVAEPPKKGNPHDD
jgi:DNA-binding transcriptional ArsR family regulator